ncbi:MAG: transcriptional regulator, LacI family [Firmicutes bacterium]|nr:transcriptional regulator, LacI family [Bacillota bacterium]
MTPTLADVARLARVSPATASRVISGSTYGVSAQLRERVLKAVSDLKYVPNAHAQALVGASSLTVGVIVGDMSDPYFAEVTRGIQNAAIASGRLTMMCNSFRDPERELAYIRLLHAQRVEAIIMAGGGVDDRVYSQKLASHIDAFTAVGGRVTFISRHHVVGNAVLPDNVGGARAIGRALVALGHRQIGVISGPKLLTTTRDRMDGFRSALAEADVTLPPGQIVHGDFSRDSGAEAAGRLLDRAPDITAIFALNDGMAIGALSVLRNRGIAVPAAMSVVGFDDIPAARDVMPALSTVHLPMVECGARAMELALSQRGSELRVEHVPTQVVLRNSTAPPRNR